MIIFLILEVAMETVLAAKTLLILAELIETKLLGLLTVSVNSVFFLSS